MALRQAEHAVAGAEADFRIAIALHDRGDKGVDMGTDVACTIFELCAGVLDIGALVRLGLMLLERGGTPPGIAAQMACDLFAAVEHVDQPAAQADIDLLADIRVGHGIEMALDGNVIVAMDRVLAPHRPLPALVRQRLHMRDIDALEAAEAVLARTVGIGFLVDLSHPGCNRPVQRCQIMEDMVAQRRQDPALDQEDSIFDQCLVSGLPDPRRQALNVVMLEQVGVGLVQDRARSVTGSSLLP